jgi:magnesium chelatase family protein
MTVRTYALTRVGYLMRLVTIEADIEDGLPETVLRGLPSDSFHTTRDRIRAAIVNSGEQWPAAKITVGLSTAKPMDRTSSFDLAIGIAILAAAGDVPEIQLQSTLFLAELGLNGRLRQIDGIAELLAAATRDALPTIPEDNAFVVVVATLDAPAAMAAISQSQVPYVRVVGAQHLRDVVAWLRGTARLGLTLVEDQAE